jgi:hypothetical protein
VRNTTVLRLVRDAATTPIRFAALAATVAKAFSGVALAKIHKTLSGLVTQGILITNLRAPMTVTDPLGHLIATLERAADGTMHRNTGAYDTSYRIRDVNGLCLAPTEPQAPEPDLYPLHGYSIIKSVMRPCDDGEAQKWNANPWALDARPVEYVGER